MSHFNLPSLPAGLSLKKNAPLLTGIMRGVERETLRVHPDGTLAQSPHPHALGSALTHPQITTDFSEALLEFITPPSHDIDSVFYHLLRLQQFCYNNLDDELLWPGSMPCRLPEDSAIPVARYGKSNNGIMKTVYREGLSLRYGRAMQTVAGLHYNFSLPSAFWSFMAEQDNSPLDLSAYRNKKYFALIRNFRRHYWLLIYLFGASPALDLTFVQGRQHQLATLADGQTLFAPYATSLRMGDLGYQSSAQESLFVCYNQRKTYIQTLCNAIKTPLPDYEAKGLKTAEGKYQQLNTGLLQIENEFYSAIRPKRTAQPGETALAALNNRGVEYVEVRCLDIDPWTPVGITATQARFIDTFMLYCALQDSPACDEHESRTILANQKQVVNRGREPQLQLQHPQQGKMSLKHWGSSLINGMQSVAQLLDDVHEGEQYQQALKEQADKLEDAEKTPSAKLLTSLINSGKSYQQTMLDLANQHKNYFLRYHNDPDTTQRMIDMADESHATQAELESQSTQCFESFLAEYYEQYRYCDCSG